VTTLGARGVHLPPVVSAGEVSWVVSLVTVPMSAPVAATVAVPPTDWHTEWHHDASSEEHGSKDQVGEESDVRHVVPPWSVQVRRGFGTALQHVRGHPVEWTGFEPLSLALRYLSAK
jgi:hypothetical protein